jgi:Zn-dependent peptidase ImmA (M78 family)
MITRNSTQHPAQCARDLLERLGTRRLPIPVDRIARTIGAQVVFSPLDDELSGMVFVRGHRTIIGVNSLHHPNRQRFTISHEIGHLELHRQFISEHVHVDKKFTVLMRDVNSATGTDRLEIEANRFAAELLMPDWALQRVLDQNAIDIDDDTTIAELARKFHVSRQAFQYRLISFFSSVAA